MSKKKSSNSIKILVIGDSGVGKTCLLLRYCQNTFQHDYISTIGVDFKIKRMVYKQKSYNLNIWDTAGQERFKNVTKSFYKGAHGIVLCYSVDKRDSFNHIQSWLQTIKQNADNKIGLVIAANKMDIQDRKITRMEGEQLAQKYKIGFQQVSSLKNININKLFQKLLDDILQKKTFTNTTQSILIKKPTQQQQNNNKCCS